MKSSLVCLSALLLAGRSDADCDKEPPVLPAIVYRDHLLTHYREPTFRYKPYVIAVRPLSDSGVRSTLNLLQMYGPRNDFESLFVRGRVLVVGDNDYIRVPSLTWGNSSTDTIRYLSADRLRDAKLMNVDPTGKPTQDDIRLPNPEYVVWRRHADVTPLGFPLQGTDIVHTSMAAAGERDILVFDLIRTVLVQGKPTPPPMIAVTRVTPDPRPVLEGVAVQGKPAVKAEGQVTAAFTEPFQSYLIGEDYYFVTRSGGVYRSAPPKKGRPRTMTMTWVESQPPSVRFVVSDGHRPGVHFLITAGKESGWDYLRLGPDVDPLPTQLDRDARRPGEAPAETLYWLVQKLREKKEIIPSK